MKKHALYAVLFVSLTYLYCFFKKTDKIFKRFVFYKQNVLSSQVF